MIFFNFRRAQLALLGAGSRMEEARALLLKRVESRHNNTTNDSSNELEGGKRKRYVGAGERKVRLG